jgi:hypothetical protein
MYIRRVRVISACIFVAALGPVKPTASVGGIAEAIVLTAKTGDNRAPFWHRSG